MNDNKEKFELNELVCCLGVFAKVTKIDKEGNVIEVLMGENLVPVTQDQYVFKLTFNRLKVMSLLFMILGVLTGKGVKNTEEKLMEYTKLSIKLFKYSENEELFEDLYSAYVEKHLSQLID